MGFHQQKPSCLRGLQSTRFTSRGDWVSHRWCQAVLCLETSGRCHWRGPGGRSIKVASWWRGSLAGSCDRNFNTQILLQGLENVKSCWIKVRAVIPRSKRFLPPKAQSLNTLMFFLTCQEYKIFLIKKLSYQTCKVPQRWFHLSKQKAAICSSEKPNWSKGVERAVCQNTGGKNTHWT